MSRIIWECSEVRYHIICVILVVQIRFYLLSYVIVVIDLIVVVGYIVVVTVAAVDYTVLEDYIVDCYYPTDSDTVADSVDMVGFVGTVDSADMAGFVGTADSDIVGFDTADFYTAGFYIVVPSYSLNNPIITILIIAIASIIDNNFFRSKNYNMKILYIHPLPR